MKPLTYRIVCDGCSDLSAKSVQPTSERWQTLLDEGCASIIARLKVGKSLREDILEFNHRYTIKIRDDKAVVKALAIPEEHQGAEDLLDRASRASIYKLALPGRKALITPSDEAITLMFYMNKQAVWQERADKFGMPDDDVWHKKGIWTQRGRGRFVPGYTNKGMAYFAKALELFRAIRADKELLMLMHLESTEWYDANWDGRREIRGKKRTGSEMDAGGDDVAEQEPASMEDFFDFLDEESDEEEEAADVPPLPPVEDVGEQGPHEFQAQSSPAAVGV